MEYEKYLKLESSMSTQSCSNTLTRKLRRERKKEEERKNRVLANDIVQYVLDEINSSKIGVLFCEGDENSIDKVVYSAIFPDLMVIPLGSCSTVMRVLPRVRKKLSVYHLYAFGIIDRDALSKQEVKKLFNEKGVNTTKLPFIENIICTPEVISYVCKSRGLNYENSISRIQDELIRILWRQLKETLPINIAIQKQEKIEFISIQTATKYKKVEKIVNRENVLYAYRDKVIVSIVGLALKMKNKKAYYEEIKMLLQQEEYSNYMVKAMAKYVPKLQEYSFEDV